MKSQHHEVMNSNARNLQEARARHGKPFVLDVHVRRRTPPSPFLRRLNTLSARAAQRPAVIRSNRKVAS